MSINRILSRPEKAFCGHELKDPDSFFPVSNGSEVKQIRLIRNKHDQKITFCPQCFKKWAIKCSDCGNLIFPGEDIFITPASSIFNGAPIPLDSSFWNSENHLVIVCPVCSQPDNLKSVWLSGVKTEVLPTYPFSVNLSF